MLDRQMLAFCRLEIIWGMGVLRIIHLATFFQMAFDFCFHFVYDSNSFGSSQCSINEIVLHINNYKYLHFLLLFVYILSIMSHLLYLPIEMDSQQNTQGCQADWKTEPHAQCAPVEHETTEVSYR